MVQQLTMQAWGGLQQASKLEWSSHREGASGGGWAGGGAGLWGQGWHRLVQQGRCRHWDRRGAATNESYEERQMLWEGVASSGWFELVQ